MSTEHEHQVSVIRFDGETEWEICSCGVQRRKDYPWSVTEHYEVLDPALLARLAERLREHPAVVPLRFGQGGPVIEGASATVTADDTGLLVTLDLGPAATATAGQTGSLQVPARMSFRFPGPG